MKERILVIACGAIAHELVAVTRQNAWGHLKIRCLPPELHNTPAKIPGAVLTLVEENLEEFERIFVAYADCGTGGMLDKALAPYGIERLPGAHCYEFFTGPAVFAQLADAEPGTFFLTDFLVRHFERLVVRGLGLDRHPQLKDEYFRNYRRVVYLAQSPSAGLGPLARSHADFLGLAYEEHCTGLVPVENALREHMVQWQS